MKKQGVSAVVATVLIVLITVSAVAIVWSTIIPMITDSLESTTGEKANLQIVTNQGYTIYDPTNKILKVQVSRGQDSLDIENMELQVAVDGKTIEPIIVLAPEPGQTKTYQISLVDYGAPTSVSVSYKETEKKSYSVSSETSQPIPSGSLKVEGIINLPGSVNTAPAEIYDNLIGYWAFENDLRDYSGNENDGVGYGASISDHLISFDGIDDYVTLPDPRINSTNFTISLWLKSNDVRNQGRIFSYGTYTSSFWPNNIECYFNQGYLGNFRCGGPYYDESHVLKTMSVMFLNNNLIKNDDWVHFLLTYDRNSGFVDLYINSVLQVHSSFYNISISEGILGKFYLGSRTGGVSSFFSGSLDEIMIFGRTFSNSEVVELYDAEKSRLNY